MMGDSCICLDVDCDRGDIITNKVVKARKNHVCTECGAIINKGDKYEDVHYVADSGITIYKTCLPCKSMRDDLFKCGFYYTHIWEDLKEHFIEVLSIETEEDEDWKWLREVL